MNAYRPPGKSFLQKFSESLAVQLTLVVVIGILAVMVITRNHKQNFWSRVHFLRGSSTQVSMSKEGNQFTAPQVTASQDQTSSVTVADDSAKRALEAKIANEPKTVAKSAGPKTKIYYLDIPQTVLGKWLEDGALTRVETSDDVTIGYIPQLTQLLEQYKTQIKVLKVDDYSYSLNQLYTAKLEKAVDSTNMNRTVASTAAPVDQSRATNAVTTYATLEDDRNDTLTGQLEVSVNPQTSFPAQFEMSADQSFFISGFDKVKTSDHPASNELVVVLKIDK
jgi:hypothetical protein